MGDNFEFNHILKLEKRDLENLALKKQRVFTKKGNRIYSELPILAVDENWNAKCYVLVKDQFKRIGNKEVYVGGIFEPVYIFNEEERQVYSNVLKTLFNSK